MTAFVRVVELWLPTQPRTELSLGGALGAPDGLRTVSEQTRFRPGEGIPGRAWASGHPIFVTLREFTISEHGNAAAAAGLTCAAALPIFAGEFLMATVVFWCGGGPPHVGAVELWHNDPATSREMRHVGGYYGAADNLEFDSRYMKFPPGYGLPGRAWKTGAPVIVKDLVDSQSFLRREKALEVGINRGLGIPFAVESGANWVLTFLSAPETPIARRFEIWVPNRQRDGLVFHSGDCHRDAQLGAGYASETIRKDDGVLGRVWLTGVPEMTADIASEASRVGRSARAAGLDAMLALPVLEGGKLKGLVAWYF